MADPDPRAVLDMSVVDSLRALDEVGGASLFEELVELFIQDAAQQVRSLEQALGDGDARAIERSAHTLKSSSASLGATRMSELCFELERLGRAGRLDGAQGLVGDVAEAFHRACRALESLRS